MSRGSSMKGSEGEGKPGVDWIHGNRPSGAHGGGSSPVVWRGETCPWHHPDLLSLMPIGGLRPSPPYSMLRWSTAFISDPSRVFYLPEEVSLQVSPVARSVKRHSGLFIGVAFHEDPLQLLSACRRCRRTEVERQILPWPRWRNAGRCRRAGHKKKVYFRRPNPPPRVSAAEKAKYECLPQGREVPSLDRRSFGISYGLASAGASVKGKQTRPLSSPGGSWPRSCEASPDPLPSACLRARRSELPSGAALGRCGNHRPRLHLIIPSRYGRPPRRGAGEDPLLDGSFLAILWPPWPGSSSPRGLWKRVCPSNAGPSRGPGGKFRGSQRPPAGCHVVEGLVDGIDLHVGYQACGGIGPFWTDPRSGGSWRETSTPKCLNLPSSLK